LIPKNNQKQAKRAAKSAPRPKQNKGPPKVRPKPLPRSQRKSHVRSEIADAAYDAVSKAMSGDFKGAMAGGIRDAVRITMSGIPATMSTNIQGSTTAKGPGAVSNMVMKEDYLRMTCRYQAVEVYIYYDTPTTATRASFKNWTGDAVSVQSSQTSGDCYGVFPVAVGDMDSVADSTYYRQDFFFPSYALMSIMSKYFKYWRPKSIHLDYVPACSTSEEGNLHMSFTPTTLVEFQGGTPYFPYNNSTSCISQNVEYTRNQLYMPGKLTAYPLKHGVAQGGSGWLQTHGIQTGAGNVDRIDVYDDFAGCLVFLVDGVTTASTTPHVLGHIYITTDYEFKGIVPAPLTTYGYNALPPEELLSMYAERLRRRSAAKKSAGVTVAPFADRRRFSYDLVEPERKATRSESRLSNK